MFQALVENKAHFVRKFYSRYLKKYRICSAGKDFLVKRVLMAASRSYLKRGVSYRVKSITEFSSEHKIAPRTLIESARESVPSFQFYCPTWFSPKNTRAEYASPRCAMYEIDNATVMARTDFVFRDGFLVHPDEYSLAEHVCTLEQHGVGKLSRTKDVIQIKTGLPTCTVRTGVNLLSGGAGNYAHFISEVIPKLLALDELKVFLDYPLLVDGWIGRRLIQILVYFNSHCREILALGAFERIFVDKLVHVSPAVFAPQDFRANFSDQSAETADICNESYRFSEKALQLVRNYAWRKSQLTPAKINSGKRIYLRRRATFIDGVQYNQREIINDVEVTAILTEYGFQCIDVTQLSFEEQVEIFKGAEVIAAPLGAAMVNTVFSRPGAVVLGLGAYYVNADYSYHANMMAALGHRYFPVLGPQFREGRKHPMHNNYFVCTDSLRRALREVL